MSTSLSQDLRCPRCDAHVQAGADWCTLCYHDLRPAVVEPAVVEPAAVEPAAVEPEPAPAPIGRHVAGPVSTDDATGPDATSMPDAAPGLADTQIALMLAQLAAEESGPPLGSISSRLTSPGAKFAFIIGGSIVATTVVFLVMTLVGSLL